MSFSTRNISETIRYISQKCHHTRGAGGTTQLNTQEVTDSDNVSGHSWTVEEFMNLMHERFALNANPPEYEHNGSVDEEDDFDEDFYEEDDYDEYFDEDLDSDYSIFETIYPNDSDEDMPLCEVCVDTNDTQELSCCLYRICDACLRTYFGVELMAGKGRIHCPMCSKPLGDDFIDGYLSDDSKVRLNQNKVDRTRDPNRKTCPGCKLVTNRSKVPNVSNRSSGMPITCIKCDFRWCFECHGPYHEGRTCASATGEGDAQLKRWAKHYKNSQKNARRCPGCKTYVQRSEGCDHMICVCGAKFCYKCGRKSIDRTNGRRRRCTCDRINNTRHVAKLVAIGSGVVVGCIVALPIIVGVGAASIPVIPVVFGVKRIRQAIKKRRQKAGLENVCPTSFRKIETS